MFKTLASQRFTEKGTLSKAVQSPCRLNKFCAEVKTFRSALFTIGFAMAFVGSIILIGAGALAALGIFLLIYSPLFAIGSLTWGIIMIILGLLGAGAAPFCNRLIPALWLILLAIIASLLGAWYIGWLIAIGAILGLLGKK
jgi:hypothetical protein